MSYLRANYQVKKSSLKEASLSESASASEVIQQILRKVGGSIVYIPSKKFLVK